MAIPTKGAPLRAWLSTLVLASSVLIASCGGGPVDVVNDSNRPILIMKADGEDASVLAEVPATGGVSFLRKWIDPCIDEDLGARAQDGTLVETHPGPFCPDDPAWTITPDVVAQARS